MYLAGLGQTRLHILCRKHVARTLPKVKQRKKAILVVFPMDGVPGTSATREALARFWIQSVGLEIQTTRTAGGC